MRWRWSYSFVALFGIGLVGAGIVWILRPREPIYHGQQLSYWVEQLWSPGADQEEARRVLAEAQAEAVPFLLQKVRRGAVKRQSLAVWQRLPAGVQEYVPVPDPQVDFHLNKVPYALSLMGPKAVPALLDGLRDGSPDVQSVALRALAMMGAKAEAALPRVISLLNHTNGEVRLCAISTVGQVGAGKSEAIAGLVGVLRDASRPPPRGPHPWCFREAAALALGLMGPSARPAVPELEKMLDDPTPYARRTAALALWRIQRNTNLVIRLIDELEQRQGVHDYKALLRTLEEMGPAAKPAVPAILKSMTNWGTDMSRVVRPALLKIDPAAAKQPDL